MPHFTTLGEKDFRHTDILAVRLPGSVERVKKATLEVDDCFFDFLKRTKDEIIPLIAEVKGGRDGHEDRTKILAYLQPMFGECGDKTRLVRFVRECDKQNPRDMKEYPIVKCIEFIHRRLDSTQEITGEVGGLTKSGSWVWSEEFLSDLLYIKDLGFLGQQV